MAKVTKSDLERILTARLGLREPEFHLERNGQRISGNIISATFRGKRDHERQEMIWDALEAELGAESMGLVGLLLAYTPDEWELGNENDAVVRKAKKAG
jgi:acid stress-induced BolA-like protein IbaG/YrbA